MGMGLYDAAFATLTRLYGTAARKPITGITLIAGFASTIGWPISAYLDAHFGWRTACLVWAAVHLLLALPLNLTLPRASLQKAVPQSENDAQTGRTERVDRSQGEPRALGHGGRCLRFRGNRLREHRRVGGAADDVDPDGRNAGSRDPRRHPDRSFTSDRAYPSKPVGSVATILSCRPSWQRSPIHWVSSL